jgi:TM2 domain-containing membrane protein YozV
MGAEMFCKNCGKELTGTPEICPNCGAKPLLGTSFCQGCGAAITPLTEICMKCGTRVAKEEELAISPKSRLATTLLAVFLGAYGAHRFYLGKIGSAVGMLILGIAGSLTWWVFGIGFVPLIIVGIWAFIDFIYAVTGRMKDKQGRLIKKW